MLLKDKLSPFKLILASNSPRRRQLIADAGFAFTIAEPYEVDESFPEDMPASQVPLFLSQLKSRSYPNELNETEILITADTIVSLGGEVIGKPSDRAGAIEILSRLSAVEHEVITGVTIRSKEKSLTFSSQSFVSFRELSLEEIEYYVDNYSPYDKAGAYGIQEWIGYVGIEGITGSFYNVMGLPVQKLYTALDQFLRRD